VSRLAQHWKDHPRYADGAWNVFNAVVLDTEKELGSVAVDWEYEMFAATLDLPRIVYHRSKEREPEPFSTDGKDLIECCGPVGCGKDQIIAAVAIAIVMWGPKGCKTVKQSTSREKSKDVIDTVNGFLLRTPKLQGVMEVVRDEIRAICPECKQDRCMGDNDCKSGGIGSTLSKVVCSSLDGSAAVGIRALLYLINECQEWGYRGPKVYEHMFARYRKMGGRFVCFTNAPFTAVGDWRRDRWEEARREGSDWWYRQVSWTECPWMAEDIPIMQRNMPSQVFRRLYLCEPSDGRGELVTKDEMMRCIMPELAMAHAPMRAGRRYLGGDLATKKDHAALVLLCVTDDGAVFVERVDVWVPTEEEDIPLPEVKERAREYLTKWGAHGAFDPHQAVQMVQELQAEGCRVETIPFTQVNLVDMCSAVREVVRNGRLRLYPNAGHTDVGHGQSTNLVQQIVDAEIKVTERGERIVSQRSVAGHGDQLSAFALAAMAATRALPSTGAFGFGSEDEDRKDDPRAIRGHFGHKAHRPSRRKQEVA